MPFMYILKCSDGTYYTGSTINLERRIWQHEIGAGAEYTKMRRPVKLVYFEQYERIENAYRRERQVHHWSHKKKDALIYGKPSDIQREAKKVFKKNEDAD